MFFLLNHVADHAGLSVVDMSADLSSNRVFMISFSSSVSGVPVLDTDLGFTAFSFSESYSGSCLESSSSVVALSSMNNWCGVNSFGSTAV